MTERTSDRQAGRLVRLGGLVLLHGLAYVAVTRLTLLRPAGAFIDPTIGLDARIPHIPESWPLYWIPYVLVPVGAGLAALRLPDRPFRRLCVVWAGMIVLGGVVQVLFPAVAPWPADPAPAQRAFHESRLILPYATLPSMHVAHTALGAALFARVYRSRPARAAALAVVIAVTAATLTLKEHLVLDAAGGLALAVAAWVAWRWGERREEAA